jgi:hypothetical protein
MNRLNPFNYELIFYQPLYYLLLFCNNLLQSALQICEIKIYLFLKVELGCLSLKPLAKI